MSSDKGQESWEKWEYVEGIGWWPYGDLVLDDYERELEESIARGEWRLSPDQEGERARAVAMARATMATWSEEQRAEVKRRVAQRAADARARRKWPPPPAGGAGPLSE